MKNILIIVFSIIVSCLYGQTKKMGGNVQPLSDNITTNTSGIATLVTNTDGISGYNLSFSGDTLIVEFDGKTMNFTKASGGSSDVTPPEYSSGNIGTRSHDSISIIFNETVEWSSPVITPFAVTVDEVEAIIEGISHSGTTVLLQIDSAVTANQTVVVTYTQPTTTSARIADPSGNYLRSFSRGVINTVPSVGDTITTMGWWKVNNNLNDVGGTYDGTASGTVLYSTSIKKGGTHSTNLQGGGSIDLGIMDLGDSATIMYWWYGDRNPGADALISFANRTSSTNNDGIMIWHSSWATDNGFIWVYTGNGASQASAVAGGYIQDNTWIHIAVTLDKVNGIGHIYANGTQVDTDSTILTDFAMSGNNVTWGADNTNSHPSAGYFDDMRIYDRILSLDDINTIYSNPELTLTGENPGDSPIAESDFDVIYYLDLDAVSDQVGLSDAELDVINPNTWYLGGELDDICETAGIVTHDGSKWLRSYHDKNTCCVETNTSVPSNGGSGILWTMYIDDARAQHNDGYYTYTAYWPPGYSPGDGSKMPALQTTEGFQFDMTLAPMPDVGTSIMNMSHVNVADSIDIQWYIYPHLYADYLYGRTHSRDGSGLPAGIIDRFVMGEEFTLTVRYFGGDTGTKNGFVEWFRDGVLIDQWLGLNFTESSSIVLDAIGIFTFAGGASQSYYASADTYWDIRNYVFYRYNVGVAGVPAYNVPSNPGRVLEFPNDVDYKK